MKLKASFYLENSSVAKYVVITHSNLFDNFDLFHSCEVIFVHVLGNINGSLDEHAPDGDWQDAAAADDTEDDTNNDSSSITSSIFQIFACSAIFVCTRAKGGISSILSSFTVNTGLSLFSASFNISHCN